MRKVAAGEPITSQHLSAKWYNSTLEKPHQPPSPPGKEALPRHNEILAVLQGAGPVERFDPVGLSGRADQYGNRVDRTHVVSLDALNEYNWIIAQAKMDAAFRVQPCVYFGITYANVIVSDANHKFVTLDPDTKKLISSDSGKGQILVGGSVDTEPQPLFISIGNIGSGAKEYVDVPINVTLTSTHLEFEMRRIWVSKIEDLEEVIQIPVDSCPPPEE